MLNELSKIKKKWVKLVPVVKVPAANSGPRPKAPPGSRSNLTTTKNLALSLTLTQTLFLTFSKRFGGNLKASGLGYDS